jgi:hypothetical protein
MREGGPEAADAPPASGRYLFKLHPALMLLVESSLLVPSRKISVASVQVSYLCYTADSASQAIEKT